MAADDDEAVTGGLGDLFAQFEQAQERIETAAAEASSTIVEGSAGDGRVVVQMRGDLDALSVHIDPSLVDPSDVGLLEDLLLAAIRDGLAQVAELQEEVAGALGGGGGGLDVGSLLGSLGNVPGLAELGNLANLPGLAELGNLANLGAFDAGALAQLPELRGLGVLAGEMSESAGYGDEDDEEEGTAPSGRQSEQGGAGGPAAEGGTGSGGTGSLDKPAGDGDAGSSGPG